MHINRLFSFAILVLALLISQCSSTNNVISGDNKTDSIRGLKDKYENYFSMGVAVTPRNLRTDEARLILQQFNSLTAENAMKMGPIHPFESLLLERC